ncbi:polymorphic toxin-type HINT domain-containing protein [Terrisporobacter sp.]|uniref:polymorphic toxin-type HINT domain-containing protein n=1 Tax=Terrisporobacter sp. TaxID=1965305 RepID=UPI00289CEAA2|nr:polymorphic toxin-type HINT domain-containing protein [Terrisporobacter sp.]
MKNLPSGHFPLWGIIDAGLGAYDGYQYAKRKNLSGWKKAGAIVGGAVLGTINPFKKLKLGKVAKRIYKVVRKRKCTRVIAKRAYRVIRKTKSIRRKVTRNVRKKATRIFKKKKTRISIKKRRHGNRKVKNNNSDNSYCFVEGTLVSTEEGLVPIEDIKEGDLVWSQNPETGEIKLKKVEQLFINKSDTILRINIAGEIIEATEQHVFYIDNVGWIPANMIEEGDVVVLQSGERAIVEDIDKIVYDEPITVYNFEVEDFHTYFVSNVNVLVHNRCDINAKKSNNHSRTNKNPGPRGERNSSVDILDDDGNVKTRRWYDGDGRADRDVDFTDHGNPKQHPKVPHEHKWDWKSGKPKRR